MLFFLAVLGPLVYSLNIAMNDIKPLPEPIAIFVSLIIFGIAVAVYFIPTIIAFKRKKKDRLAIGALNLLLGWTFLGWVIAFVWSLKSD